MRKKISQRQAKRTERDLRDLMKRMERIFSRWSSDFPGGPHIDNVAVTPIELAIVNTAVACGCVVLVKPDGNNGRIKLYAVRQ